MYYISKFYKKIFFLLYTMAEIDFKSLIEDLAEIDFESLEEELAKIDTKVV